MDCKGFTDKRSGGPVVPIPTFLENQDAFPVAEKCASPVQPSFGYIVKSAELVHPTSISPCTSIFVPGPLLVPGAAKAAEPSDPRKEMPFPPFTNI
jgi:hypothetical protein